jgi:hypothetical protein
MRNKLIFAMFLMLAALPARAAIGFVQIANGTAAAGTTCVVTITTTSTNTLVMTTSDRPVTSIVSSITDSAGTNTWTNAAAVTDSGNAAHEEAWTTQVSSNSVTSVTVHYSVTLTHAICHIAEYSGVQAIGLNNTNSNASGTNPTVSITTQDANNFVVAGLGENGNNIYTAQNGNLRQQTSANTRREGTVDNTAVSASSVTCSVTYSGNAPWVAAAVELRSTSGAAAPTGINKRQKYEQVDP